MPRTVQADPDSEDERPPVFRSIKKRYGENREFDAKAPWREWVRERYAKQWYGIACVVLDVMLVGTILQSTDPSQVWPYLLSAAVVVGLSYLELKVLRRFWPPKPIV
jgi:hypothetical protein